MKFKFTSFRCKKKMFVGHTVLVVLLLVCQIIGLILFLRGFFPLKKAIQGRASNENLPPEPSMKNTGHPMPPKFERVVIVLVDALRADFVFSERSTMPFTQDLIKKNKTFSYLAKAHPPTVTMPRIKAITTGGIPGFVDVILNLHSKSLQEDNMIGQMKFAKKKLVFYGDDTWMKLFPGHFLRTDGTTSFFVTDFTEVDNNVTRHIDQEFKSNDWDTMILHYLGLDHIGHIAGPASPLVGPKLLEMDQVIRDIYSHILRWDHQRDVSSLLILCGDHGMSDAGSHGGASLAETSTPLVFMSPLFELHGGEGFSGKQVQQIDLAPTLSLLLGLPIPQNSVGIATIDLFSFHGPRQMLRALQLNTHQVSQVLIANGHTVDDIWEVQQAYKLHSDWLKSAATNQTTLKHLEVLAGKAAKQYILALAEMSGRVTASLSNYDLHAMISGIVVLLQTLYWIVYGLFQPLLHQKSTASGLSQSVTSVFIMSGAVLLVAVLHMCVCSSQILGGSDIMCSSTSTESICFGLVFTLISGVTLGMILLTLCFEFSNVKAFVRLPLLLSSKTSKLLIAGVLWHTVSLLSSSYVEEEHQTWYFLTSTYFIVLLFDKTTVLYLTKKSELSNYEETDSDQSESPEKKFSRKVMKRAFLNNGHVYLKSQFHGTDKCSPNSAIADNHSLQTLHGKTETLHCGSRDLSETFGRHSFYTTIPNITLKELFSCAVAVTVLLTSGRLARAWNQTGIKWANRPDIGDWLVKPENRTCLSLLFLVSLLVIIIFRWNRHDSFSSLLLLTGAAFAYGYRAVTASLVLPWIPNQPITKGINEARCAYCCVAAMVIWSFVYYFKASHNFERKRNDFPKYIFKIRGSLEILLSSLLLLEILLQRPHNVTLLAAFVVQEQFLSSLFWKSQDKTWIIILSSLWMGHAMFFSQGNSNSLATVDIAAGYVGLQDHVPSVVGPLMCVSTYSGPLLWLLAALLSIVTNGKDAVRLWNSLHQSCYIIILSQLLVLCVYCMVVYGMRYHLFVWTVFSPKLLYEAVKTFVLSTCVLLILGLANLIGRT